MEFMIFFALLSIIFAIWLVIYLDLNEEVLLKRDTLAIEDVGKAIQTQFFIASESRPGFFSKNLIIPEKAGHLSYEINNTPYLLLLRSSTQDRVFNIPFTNGTLKKGQNILWNVCGVIFIGDYPPISDLDCNELYYTNCSDGVDNDFDLLIDQIDGGCWFNYTSPSFDRRQPSEMPNRNVSPILPDEVYNYYVPCRNANETNMCYQISNERPWAPGLNYTAQDCCMLTFEKYCPTYCP